ncbi:MAG: neutral/alkaline non-lysosomal ceramidase N-terminal domain-containing protein [Clostridia bacterium]|nr:neutral/alkaline non-lysosomal ceramidase N-terminal domain-containing protein [Clostridia bacterium]
MKAITGKVKITPDIGTPMGGNVRLDNKARGVHDDLFCNILILNDGRQKICMMSFDLVGLKEETCDQLKKAIAERTDIHYENIVLFATHTHSGPDSCMRMYHGIGDEINHYLDDMVRKVKDEVDALNNKVYTDVVLKTGKTQVNDLSFNRRLVRRNKEVVMNFEPFEIDDIIGATGPIDPELITLSVFDTNDKLISVMVNFSLHAAVLVSLDWLFSRDFIDGLDKQLKEIYGDELVVLFANGAEGNINHLNYEDPNQWRDFRETDRIGRKLGVYAADSINHSVLINGEIQFVSKELFLPLREIRKEEIEWAEMVMIRDKDKIEDMFDGIPDKTYAKMVLAMAKRKETTYRTIVQGLFTDNFAFITFPGEVYVEFGLEVKKSTKQEYTAIIGLANSYSGYIPKAEAFAQGGYEVRTAWSSQMVHHAGDILVDFIKKEIIGDH